MKNNIINNYTSQRYIKIPNKAMITVLFTIVLTIMPSLLNIGAYPNLSNAFVFESSAFSADYAYLFQQFLLGHSFWFWGQYTILPINYFPFYFLHWVLQHLSGSNLVAYHIIVIIAQIAALSSFANLCQIWSAHYSDSDCIISKKILAWLLGAAFLTSLASFNYLKSNLFFALPYYSLPIQLLLVELYRISQRIWILFFLMIVVMLMNTFNITHFIYIQGLILFYSIFFKAPQKKKEEKFHRSIIICLGISFLPPAILTGGAWIVNLPYYGSLDELVTIMTEEMYSQHAGILNALLQITDWGIFGQFNGELYYKYSPYYLHTITRLFGLIIPLYVVFMIFLRHYKVEESLNRLIFFWGIIALTCLFFLPGEKNDLFSWLYHNIFLFKIFRNITKLNTMLIFSLLVLAFLLSLEKRFHITRTRKWQLISQFFLISALVSTFIYNLPYWLNASYFFHDRSVQKIPIYWYNARDFLVKNLSQGSRILMLPATYIHDIYLWDNKKNWVQGNLPDAIWPIPTFRLSEGFIGPLRMQQEMKNTFVKKSFLPRQLSVDFDMLVSFSKRNAFDFLVLTRDLMDDYQFTIPFESRVYKAGFRKLAEFGPIIIFHNPENYRPLISLNTDFSYSRLDNLTYQLKIKNIKTSIALVFQDEYRPGWKIIPARYDGDISCVEQCLQTPIFTHFSDIIFSFNPISFSDKHIPSIDGSNVWILDINSLRSRLPHESIQENKDGSFNISLIIYFSPQLGFIMMIWIFIASLIVCIIFFGFSPIKGYLNKST